MKNNKIWGVTSLLWAGNNTEFHHINVNKDCYCSKHKHDYKYNFFYVESGELQIEIWNENGIVDCTTIGPGESTVIPPKIYHKFTSTKETSAFEVYWVHLKSDDIIREDIGGKL